MTEVQLKISMLLDNGTCLTDEETDAQGQITKDKSQIQKICFPELGPILNSTQGNSNQAREIIGD